MSDARLRFWRRWLVLAGAATVPMGLLLALWPRSPLLGWWHAGIDAALFGAAPPPAGAEALRHWLCGVLGASMAAWGLLYAAVAAGPFGRREPWARNALAASLLFWFPVDTALSWAWGVHVNVAFNAAALAVLALPLAATWRAFPARDPEAAALGPLPRSSAR